MICPVCDMGILDPQQDEKGYRFNICDNCGVDLVTPKDQLYNKAKRAINIKNGEI